MISKGTILKSKTTTKNDMFGTVIWEVIETGLKAPETGREQMTDGVKVVLVSGSGPSAKPGYAVIDSEWHIMQDIKNGITSIVPPDQLDSMKKQFQPKNEKSIPRHGGTGVVEL